MSGAANQLEDHPTLPARARRHRVGGRSVDARRPRPASGTSSPSGPRAPPFHSPSSAPSPASPRSPRLFLGVLLAG